MSEGTAFSKRSTLVFLVLGVFVAALLVQLIFEQSIGIGDSMYWSNDAAQVASGVAPTPANITYIHPGTTILYPVAALVKLGIEKSMAVQLIMAIYIAIGTALAGLLMYLRMPQRLWWLASVLLIAFDVRFLEATPPSSVASLTWIVFFLLLWHAYEHRNALWPLICLGVCAGALIATRIDTGVFTLFVSFPLLFARFKWKSLIFAAVAIITLLACNPYLHAPYFYISYVLTEASHIRSLHSAILPMFLYTYAFGLISILLSAVLMVLQYLHPKNDDSAIPRVLYVWFLTVTIFHTLLLFLFSDYHPVRYFMPLYAVWEVLLPLWLYGFAARHQETPYARTTERETNFYIIIAMICIIVLRLSLLLLNNGNVL